MQGELEWCVCSEVSQRADSGLGTEGAMAVQ